MKLNFIGSISRSLCLFIYVENLVRIDKKGNLILGLKKMLFNNFDSSSEVDSKFNIGYAEYSL